MRFAYPAARPGQTLQHRSQDRVRVPGDRCCLRQGVRETGKDQGMAQWPPHHARIGAGRHRRPHGQAAKVVQLVTHPGAYRSSQPPDRRPRVPVHIDDGHRIIVSLRGRSTIDPPPAPSGGQVFRAFGALLLEPRDASASGGDRRLAPLGGRERVREHDLVLHLACREGMGPVATTVSTSRSTSTGLMPRRGQSHPACGTERDTQTRTRVPRSCDDGRQTSSAHEPRMASAYPAPRYQSLITHSS